MKHRDFREKSQPLVMIIPMIDIMLFLLVFFMLSTIYMVQTNNFEVNLPQSEGKMQQETAPHIISITVTEGGNILYDNSKILLKNLPPLVQYSLRENNDTIFVLYGDRNTPYEKIVGVLELLKKSGVRRVSVATEIKE